MFAPRAFAGNPLAVVFDADALTTEQCQALAFEFHLSETSFLCAPTEPGADYRVRIFTPFAELPFAGHPSVGAAHTLVRTGRLTAGHAAPGVRRRRPRPGGRRRRRDADRRAPPSLSDARAPTPSPPRSGWPRGRRPACRRTWPAAGCPSPTSRCGREPSTAPRPTTPRSTRSAWGRASRCCPGTPPPSTAYARVFAGDLRWGEDPATGSAALGTGVWLVATGLLPGDGTSSYVVRQGEKLGRPSVLSCTVTAAGGRAVCADRAAAPSCRSRAAASACRPEHARPSTTAWALHRPGPRDVGLLVARGRRRLAVGAADRAGRRPVAGASRSGATPPAPPRCCRCCSPASGPR